jgi:hypothetical protein
MGFFIIYFLFRDFPPFLLLAILLVCYWWAKWAFWQIDRDNRKQEQEGKL